MLLIAQISDLHLRPRGLPALRVVETNMLAARVVERLLSFRPALDAVLVTGDITDQGDAREYATAREVLSPLGSRLLPLPGNHDIPGQIRTSFPDSPAGATREGGKLHYAVDIGPVRVIALDSSVPEEPWGALGRDQLAWLDAELAATPDRPTLIALHHPPVAVGMAGMDRMALKDADALADVVRRHPQVGRITCGHVHRSITAAFAGTIVTVAPTPVHATSLDLRPDPAATFHLEAPAFLIHLWSADTGFVTHTVPVDPGPGPFPYWGDPSLPRL